MQRNLRYSSLLHMLFDVYSVISHDVIYIVPKLILFALMEVHHAAPARLVRPIALVYARALGSLVPDSRLLCVLRWHCATRISLITNEDKLLSNLN